MPGRRVTEFFKSMFRREPDDVPEQSKTRCYSCDEGLSPEPMGPRLLERCPKCRGIWLYQAQLKEILSQVGQKNEEGLAAVESDGHADIGHTFAPSRKKRSCPACQKEMENYKFEGTGIWIDGCPDHHGIWLDQGELRLLAQRSGKPQDSNQNQGTVLDAVSDLILGSL